MHPFIFDFNGTLFPDANIHREAWKRFMARYGFCITDEIFDRRILFKGADPLRADLSMIVKIDN